MAAPLPGRTTWVMSRHQSSCGEPPVPAPADSHARESNAQSPGLVQRCPAPACAHHDVLHLGRVLKSSVGIAAPDAGLTLAAAAFALAQVTDALGMTTPCRSRTSAENVRSPGSAIDAVGGVIVTLLMTPASMRNLMMTGDPNFTVTSRATYHSRVARFVHGCCAQHQRRTKHLSSDEHRTSRRRCGA